MLQFAKLENCFWAEAVATAAYIQNRIPTTAVNDLTPEELWSGIKPKIYHMRIF